MTRRPLLCSAAGGVRLPNFLMPPLMSNHGNFIVASATSCRWLGEQGEALGVEIYPGLRRRRGALRRERRGGRRRHRRHGIGARRRAQGRLHARHGAARQVHARRRRRARLARQAAHRRFDLAKAASRRNTASASRSSGRSPRRSTGRASCSTPSAGRSTEPPAAAPSSTTSTTTWSPSASSSTSTTRTPGSVALRRVPALQDASHDPRRLRGRQAHRLWRARDHRGRLAVGAEARSPAARWSAARPAS